MVSVMSWRRDGNRAERKRENESTAKKQNEEIAFDNTQKKHPQRLFVVSAK